MKHRYSRSERRLGLDSRITRRDFLQGAAVASFGLAGCSGAGWRSPAPLAAQDQAGYYPPALHGLRGSHPGAYENAHALRDGRRWDEVVDTGESHDLIVVGGGISGLAAAHFYRETARRPVRILVLENHDDFGGHARRNEFGSDAALQLMNGGSLSIESPRPYSPVAGGLLQRLGIDVAALSKSIEDEDFNTTLGLREAVFFDAATFGVDRLVVRDESASLAEFLRRAPLGEQVRSDIVRIEESTIDPLAGLTSNEKKQRLSRLSYRDFLLHLHGATPGVLPYYQKMTHSLYCVGIEAVSALDCWAIGLPGFQGLALAPGPAPRMGYTAANLAAHGWGQVVHFPDGNATVARALLRDLLPTAVPGSTIEDLVTSRVDYGRLDEPRSAVRVRLNATVIQARNSPGTGRSAGVDVTYVRDGVAYRTRARHCVLACWNAVIPYLCPDLPQRQQQALRSPQKTPLVYTSVGVRSWRPLVELGVASVYAPGGYFSSVELNESVHIGKYATATDPDQPTVLRLTRMPCAPGQTEREQNRAGRAELLATPFETFERQVRDQLARTLDGTGFDPARDITAITVNRWPHGYAHEYNPLFDDDLPESEQPYVIGRARNGAIAIANSDAAGAAYADAAIDQAHRAVAELLQG